MNIRHGDTEDHTLVTISDNNVTFFFFSFKKKKDSDSDSPPYNWEVVDSDPQPGHAKKLQKWCSFLRSNSYGLMLPHFVRLTMSVRQCVCTQGTVCEPAPGSHGFIRRPCSSSKSDAISSQLADVEQ